MFLCLCLIYGIASYAQFTYSNHSHLKKSIKISNVNKSLISPCGSHIVSGSDKNSIISLRNEKGKLKWEKHLDAGDKTESIAISCLKKIIIIGGKGNKVYAYNLKGKQIWKKDYNKSKYQVAISGNGENIFVAGSVNLGEKNDFIDCYNPEGELLWRHIVDIKKWNICKISTNYNGDVILIQSNSDVYILNKKKNNLKVFDIVEDDNLHDTKLFNDGSKFYASYLDNNKKQNVLTLYDIEKGLMIWDRVTKSKYNKISTDKDNNLYTCGNYSNIKIYNSLGQLLDTIITTGCINISSSKNGKIIVTNSSNALRIFDYDEPKYTFQTYRVHKTPFKDITYHSIPKGATFNTSRYTAILVSTPPTKSKIEDSVEYKQLLKEKNILLKKLSYVKVDHYLNEVEYSRKSIAPLQKLYKNKTSTAFWKSNNTLHDAYVNWRKHVETFFTFKETKSPLFKKLYDEKKKGLIDRKLFYSKNKVIEEELKTTYPIKFETLKMNFINALRKMWLAAGKQWLSQQKKNNTVALTDWLPKSSLSTLKKSTIFINLNEKITTIDSKLDTFK